MALAAEIVGDRWTLLILREAFYGVSRYDDMRADLGAPRSMLSNRLARLVEHGLMTRRAYQEPGDRERHAYVLTEAGRALALTLVALTQWGERWVISRPAPVKLVDRTTGKALRVALVDKDGIEAAPENARLVKRAR
ncbi:winged helix-turn-helix transcriptional regulator [Desertibaculum subflavum]|uniref:winged helix-turn-helix transcriptional regulator n=1 Tax=Desertibaculum subflavum TaxID=2268458 RepID=UPI000E66331B